MRLVVLVVLVIAAGVLLGEVTMRPSAADRATLLAVYAATGAAAVAVSWGVPRLGGRSVRRAVHLVGVAAVVVVTLAVAGAAATMALSSHDLRLVGVSLAFGVSVGLVVARALGEALTRDLRAIVDAARRFAAGDRSARTGVARDDEVGAVASALDVLADRVAAAERARDRSERARREFLAAISHDLRSPLTSLRGAIEALQDGVADDPDRYLEAMRRETALLGSLIDDLFLLTRIESGALELALERVDLAELADEAIEAVGPTAARRSVTLRLDADGAVPVTASPREIGRVLRNLLDNASRHAPPSTEVCVQVTAAPIPTLTVVDEGPGFPVAFLARAFDSFTRADDARQRDEGAGAGLGLAIARGLVEAHGGTIRAQPGPGGRVTVTLPTPAASGVNRPATTS